MRTSNADNDEYLYQNDTMLVSVYPEITHSATGIITVTS